MVFSKHLIYMQSTVSFHFSAPHVNKKAIHLILYEPGQKTLDHIPGTHSTSFILSSFSENKINLSNGFATMIK